MNTPKNDKKKIWGAAMAAGAAVILAGLSVFWFFSGPRPTGPTALTLHPEKQEDIIADRRTQELKQVLSLSEDQAKQVTEVVKELRADMHALRAQHPGDLAGMIKDGKTRMQAFHESMRTLLTEEQRQTYDAMKRNRQERFGMMRQMMNP